MSTDTTELTAHVEHLRIVKLQGTNDAYIFTEDSAGEYISAVHDRPGRVPRVMVMNIPDEQTDFENDGFSIETEISNNNLIAACRAFLHYHDANTYYGDPAVDVTA
jgi:hypothetical protein